MLSHVKPISVMFIEQNCPAHGPNMLNQISGGELRSTGDFQVGISYKRDVSTRSENPKKKTPILESTN